MKEATGELNMTVITVVAIAAIAAFFYAFVWPRLKANIEQSQNCANAVCYCSDANAKNCPCEYFNSGSYQSITCPNKN